MRARRDPHCTSRLSARFATALLVAALIAAGDATSAAAGTLNTRSDHTALATYNSYLKSLLSRVPVGAARDQQLINTVDSGCLGYLAPYAKKITKSAGLALGVEVGGDLAVRFTSSAGRPFRHLSSQLLHLRWSSAQAATAIGRFVADEHALIDLGPSKLCGDVIDLGSHPHYVGPGTRRFEREFKQASAAASRALKGFVTVLQTYEAAGDGSLVTSIDRRASRYQRRANAVEGPDQTKLLGDLGLSLS